jgi:hypothetical protein
MVTYAKLASGNWGLRSDAALTEGEQVVVSKRDGSTKTETVDFLVAQDGKGWLYAIRPSAADKVRPERKTYAQRCHDADDKAGVVAVVRRPSQGRFDGAVGGVEWVDGAPHIVVERKAFRVDSDMPSYLGSAFLGYEGGWGVCLKLRACTEAEATRLRDDKLRDGLGAKRRKIASALDALVGQGTIYRRSALPAGEPIDPPADVAQSAATLRLDDGLHWATIARLEVAIDGDAVWAKPTWSVGDGGDFRDYDLMRWCRFAVGTGTADLFRRAVLLSIEGIPGDLGGDELREAVLEVDSVLDELSALSSPAQAA